MTRPLLGETALAHSSSGKGVAVGFCGAVLVALGASSTAGSHAGAWAWGVMNMPSSYLPEWSLRSAFVAGVFFIVAGWWMLRPRAGKSDISAWRILAVWAIPLLLVPPVQTADPFAYADAGWIVSQGGNPYELGLGSRGGPYAPFVSPMWIGGSVAWPPLTFLVARLGIEMFAFDPYWGVIGQRMVALAGVALIAIFVPRIAVLIDASRPVAGWLGLLNPVILIHFVGGAHVDSLAVGILVVCWWMVVRFRGWPVFIGASLLVGMAMGLKQYVGLGTVAVAGLPILRYLSGLSHFHQFVELAWRTAISALLAIGAFVAASMLSGYGLGWSGRFSRWYDVLGTDYPNGELQTLNPSFILGDFVTQIALLFGAETLWFYQIAVIFMVIVGGVVLLWLLVARPAEPLAIVGWGGLLVVLSAQQLHPWYLGFGIVALSLSDMSERSLRLVMFSTGAYIVAYGLVGAPKFALLMFIVCALLFWGVHRTFGGNGRLQSREVEVSKTA